jgi:hypothetical protein
LGIISSTTTVDNGSIATTYICGQQAVIVQQAQGPRWVNIGPDRIEQHDFGFTPNNGHGQSGPVGPFSAKLGSRHDATSKFKLVERSILLV